MTPAILHATVVSPESYIDCIGWWPWWTFPQGCRNLRVRPEGAPESRSLGMTELAQGDQLFPKAIFFT